MFDDVKPPQRQRPKTKTIEPLKNPDRTSILEQARVEDPGFKTPEEAAAELPMVDYSAPTAVNHEEPKVHRFFTKPNWPPTKKQGIIYGTLLLLLAFGIGAGWTVTHRRTIVAEKPKVVTKKVVAPAPLPIYSNLSGLPITNADLNKLPVTAAMIENSVDARPQSGLADAGVVFEAVAEGGVTRFMALFQDTAPADIGPIRSARPYYVSWATGFDAAYAHVGGSPDGLQAIKDWGTKDMNQFYNGNSYHRVSSRPAPHNVYTSLDALHQLESSKGFTSTFVGFTRKDAVPYKAPAASTNGKPSAKADTRTPASTIGMSLSGYTYDPHFTYAPATNTYDRTMAGAAHIDANGNRQISPKVVVSMVVPLSRGALDSSNAYYSNYNVLGSGTAYVFQDGTVTVGQWHKETNGGALSFTDTAGAPLALDRGQTWITAVSAANAVSYK